MQPTGQPVSVCHQWSITGMPSCRSAQSSVGGSQRSPARNSVRKLREVVAADVLAVGIVALDGAERGRRGEEGAHAVLRDDPPERARVRRADRLALVQHGRVAVEQRAVDDVRMAHGPAQVGRGPVHLARLDPVDVAHAPGERDQRGRRCRGRCPWGSRSCRRCRGCRADRWRATGTQSTGRAPAASSRQSWSRPGTSVAFAWGRWSTMQHSGLESASSIARSSSGLYGDHPVDLDAARRGQDRPWAAHR